MRDLIRLLGRYHLLLLFLVSQGFALSWYATSHGYPRGKWVRRSLAATGAWDARWSQIAAIGRLGEDNVKLASELAALRSAHEHSAAGWTHGPAQVIRSTFHATHNLLILQKLDTLKAWEENQGVMAHGFAAGRILEIEGDFALALPLTTAGIEWSGRVRREGPVGRIRWKVGDPKKGLMLDVPRSTNVYPGDTLFTTGFQGVFPPDVPIGLVVNQTSPKNEEFSNLEFDFLVDFQSLRHVEWVASPHRQFVDTLLASFHSITWTD